MLDVLKKIESEVLPDLLREPEAAWDSLDVIYHPPHVERVWRQHGSYRIFLHRIHPCGPPRRTPDGRDTEDGSLWHPHDWPSAVKIVTGRYEHGVGFHPPNYDRVDSDRAVDRVGPFVTACTLELEAGSYYEMTDPLSWHYVRPLGTSWSLSLMVTGMPYSREQRVAIAKPAERQPPLSPRNKRIVLDSFRMLYVPEVRKAAEDTF